jgi:hypothetical protein
MVGRREDRRSLDDALVRWKAPAGGTLGDRHVAGRLHERGELVIGDLGAIHPEAVDRDAVNRT